MFINLLRGNKDIPCGCFSLTQSGQLRASMVVRNCVLAGISGMIISYSYRVHSTLFISITPDGLTSEQRWVLMIATVTLIALCVLGSSLIALARPVSS